VRGETYTSRHAPWAPSSALLKAILVTANREEQEEDICTTYCGFEEENSHVALVLAVSILIDRDNGGREVETQTLRPQVIMVVGRECRQPARTSMLPKVHFNNRKRERECEKRHGKVCERLWTGGTAMSISVNIFDLRE
jgi:hypothetical protein